MSLTRIKEIKERLESIDIERVSLLNELSVLKSNEAVLSQVQPIGTPITESSLNTPDERIALFTRLFRCREDVFPKLWENQNKGTKGYSPACKVEWVDGICKKPETKCSECRNRVFIPLDENVIRKHLEGTITVGTYAIRNDDTCTFLAADFDKENWQKDVLAYKQESEKLGITVYLERSRSGNGAHAWIFFKDPAPARLARQLGSILLSHAMRACRSIRFESYDRFFPNQDTLPKGGFGNLIALPLQRLPRKAGNSVFVDDNFNPYPDQWAFLSNIRVLSTSDIYKFIDLHIQKTTQNNSTAAIDPEIDIADNIIASDQRIADTYSGMIKIHLSNNVEIDVAELPARLIANLRHIATFANPKFFELQRLRFSTWNTPRYICCAELSDNADRIILPRGKLSECIRISESAGATVLLDDNRSNHKSIKIKFTGILQPAQSKAVHALLQNDNGVLVAPPGAGKTVIGCAMICKRKQPTLILVHRKQLADQWKQRLLQFTDLKKQQVCIWNSKEKKEKCVVSIGMLQTLSHATNTSRIIDGYGLIIVDECHRVPAASFEPVLRMINARYFIGLTATPYRKDGLDKIITMQCGPILHTMTETDAQKDITKTVIIRETTFRIKETDGLRAELHEIWQAMVTDSERLSLIAADIITALSEKQFPLVLSDRTEHLDALYKRVTELSNNTEVNGFVITSAIGKKERNSYIEKARELYNNGNQVFLLSTGSLIGEGFDLPELSSLLLAMPLSFKGRLIQYAGRLHRESKGKNDIHIYDYVDSNLGLGITMFKKRLTTYRKMGYSIKLPEGSNL